MHGRSRSIDQQPASRRSADLRAGRTRDAGHPDSDKDLPPVPHVDTTAIGLVLPHLYDPASSGVILGKTKSPTSSVQGTPIAPALAIPERESSLRVKRASSPRIEEDYDQYRNMLTKSATGSQKGTL